MVTKLLQISLPSTKEKFDAIFYASQVLKRLIIQDLNNSYTVTSPPGKQGSNYGNWPITAFTLSSTQHSHI
jgi:hypothetical protein